MQKLPEPKYFHQLGSNEHLLGLEMLRQGFGGGAILSPRDLQRPNWSPTKITEIIPQYRNTERDFLVDPQAYNPNYLEIRDDINLSNTKGLATYPDISPLINNELNLQRDYGTTRFIVPGTFTAAVSDDWLDVIRRFGEAASNWATSLNESRQLLGTVAVHTEQIRNEEIRRRLLNHLANIPVNGFYLILGEIAPRTTDIETLIGVMDLIFRLKWLEKTVLLGYSGAWAMLAFPLGLDSFASSGIKNRQSFDPEVWRETKPKGRAGGGTKKYNDLWSAKLMDIVRYPDDAQLLSEAEFRNICTSDSPYSPPLDQRPADVSARNGWKRGASHRDYAWKMWDLAREFKDTGYQTRIAMVRAKLKEATESQFEISSKLRRQPPVYTQAWREAFETYISSIHQDLEFLYG